MKDFENDVVKRSYQLGKTKILGFCYNLDKSLSWNSPPSAAPISLK
jgi:hypothetical protein